MIYVLIATVDDLQLLLGTVVVVGMVRVTRKGRVNVAGLKLTARRVSTSAPENHQLRLPVLEATAAPRSPNGIQREKLAPTNPTPLAILLMLHIFKFKRKHKISHFVIPQRRHTIWIFTNSPTSLSVLLCSKTRTENSPNIRQKLHC
jgi:hypothetical protein